MIMYKFKNKVTIWKAILRRIEPTEGGVLSNKDLSLGGNLEFLKILIHLF